MGDAVSFPDVWNAVKDVAKLAENNVHIAMGSRAFVVPAGKQPIDLNWDQQIDKTLQLPSVSTRMPRSMPRASSLR